MKISFISLTALVLSFFAPEKKEEPAIPLCHGAANGMALLATNPDFIKAHAEPLPFKYTSAAGEMVKFKTPDGQMANGFLLKAKKPSNKWLFVYQEWWGLNDHIKKEAETYYNDLSNVNVLALDMYDGKVATKQEDAAKYMQGADQNRLQSITKGALAYAGPKATVASVGWCFGGMLSLQSAILSGKQAVGCVMYYGFPIQDVDKLKMLDTDVLAFFGSKDGFIPTKSVTEFEENMKKAGEKVSVKMYDANHAFANPSNPNFDKAATEDAYKRSITYLKSKLKA
ncbi:hypothetical protein GCM10027578_32990 [Spirosoma luteolum]